jgi:hypothetical protein
VHLAFDPKEKNAAACGKSLKPEGVIISSHSTHYLINQNRAQSQSFSASTRTTASPTQPLYKQVFALMLCELLLPTGCRQSNAESDSGPSKRAK